MGPHTHQGPSPTVYQTLLYISAIARGAHSTAGIAHIVAHMKPFSRRTPRATGTNNSDKKDCLVYSQPVAEAHILRREGCCHGAVGGNAQPVRGCLSGPKRPAASTRGLVADVADDGAADACTPAGSARARASGRRQAGGGFTASCRGSCSLRLWRQLEANKCKCARRRLPDKLPAQLKAVHVPQKTAF